MKPELAAFRIEISRAKELIAFGEIILGASPLLDISDLYRAALVAGVSGYDRFVHQLVHRGMLESASGKRARSDDFGKFRVSTLSALAASGGDLAESWLSAEVAVQHSLLAFQKCEKVADAVRLIAGTPIWPEIARRLGADVAGLKTNLDWIMDRRNQIVHEADVNPLAPTEKRKIGKTQVRQALSLLYRVAREIDRIAG